MSKFYFSVVPLSILNVIARGYDINVVKPPPSTEPFAIIDSRVLPFPRIVSTCNLTIRQLRYGNAKGIPVNSKLILQFRP